MKRTIPRLALALVVAATMPACPFNQCLQTDIACAPGLFLPFTIPENGARNVPRNAHIWISDGSFGQTSDIVVTTGGNKISGVVRLLNASFGSTVQQFVPEELLMPNAIYTVTVAGGQPTTFTTNDTVLSDPLSPPKTTVIDRHTPQGQCDSPSGTVALEPAGVLNLVVVAGTESRFENGRALGAVMLISTTSPVTLSAGGCGNWNGTDKVRFGTLDLAGRFSGWGEIL